MATPRGTVEPRTGKAPGANPGAISAGRRSCRDLL